MESLERDGLVELVRRDKKLNVGFLDRRSLGTGDRKKNRQRRLGIVSCDVEVTEHAKTGGDVQAFAPLPSNQKLFPPDRFWPAQIRVASAVRGAGFLGADWIAASNSLRASSQRFCDS